MKHYEFEISLLIDGELDNSGRNELFAHLAKCDECRETFTEYLQLKDKSKEFCVKEMSKPKNKLHGNNFYKISFYASAAAAVILIIMLVNIKPPAKYITKTVIKHDTLLIADKSTAMEKKLPAKTSLTAKSKINQAKKKDEKLIQYVLNIPSEKITNADIVTPKNPDEKLLRYVLNIPSEKITNSDMIDKNKRSL
jgi:Predicted transmembrane transcriptional regulator (anti-sigma factor)